MWSALRSRLLVELASIVLAPALTLSREPEPPPAVSVAPAEVPPSAPAALGGRDFSCETNPVFLLWTVSLEDFRLLLKI